MAVVCPCPVPATRRTMFQLAIKAGFPGGPFVGASTYINLVLVGADPFNEIFVSNTSETVQAQQFVFDSATGKITRFQADGVTPNPWQFNDVLVLNYTKYI